MKRDLGQKIQKPCSPAVKPRRQSVCSGNHPDDHAPFLPSPLQNVSTVPANGDVNRYGAAFVPLQFPKNGTVTVGDILVSNFNASSNPQRTGTTIVDVPPTENHFCSSKARLLPDSALR
ncbi:MAG: hypothetical protein WB630_13165 [Candidatus Acidiferrales bacterium]